MAGREGGREDIEAATQTRNQTPTVQEFAARDQKVREEEESSTVLRNWRTDSAMPAGSQR